MKNLSLLIILFELSTQITFGQIFSGSAKNKSTILYDGTALGINITDPSIGFTFNNFLNETHKNRDQQIVWGFNSNAASSDGYANFFNGGDISGDLTADGIIGISCIYGKEEAQEYKDIFAKKQQRKSVADSKLTALSAEMLSVAILAIDKYIPVDADATANKSLKGYLVDFIDHWTMDEFDSDYKTLVIEKSKNDIVFLRQLSIELKRLINEQIIEIKKVQKEVDYLTLQIAEFRAYWKRRFTVYLNPSFVARSFKLYQLDTTKYSDSFTDNVFSGGGINLGFNYNFGSRFLLGASVGYLRDNNSSELKSAEYTIREEYEKDNQQLVSEKKITAKKGEYHHSLDLYPINLDFIYFAPIPRNDSTVIAFNLYMRHISSGMLRARPETTNLGLGIYFFSDKSSKFLGGIYFEAPDIHNNVARNDPEGKIRPLHKRLTFGITTKFTFSTLSSLFK